VITISLESTDLLFLKGTVEHFEAVSCKVILQSCLNTGAGKNVNIDLSGLESVSSVTLSFLLYGLRSAKLLSCHLSYKNMPPPLFNMARVSGIEGILVN
jgi:anti-anti-sigma regulatory factor